MATTVEMPNMEALTKIHAKGWELQSKMGTKAPDPKDFLHLFQPMKFRKKNNKPFHIREMKSWGHKGDGIFDVTSMRHKLMLGVRGLAVKFPVGTTFHELVDDHKGGRLTSDLPVEIYSQYIEFSKVYGDVLVGGLGLGMAAELILRLPGVTSVTVVEKEQKIIDLIKPQIDPRIEVIHRDLFDYLKILPGKRKFDSAYFDIWYGTGESDWVGYVAPLYRLARKAGIQTVTAWGEWEMKWQLISALYTRSKMDEKFSEWTPYRVFVNGLKKELGGKPPYGDKYDERIEELIGLYLNGVGTPEWEAVFDGDELVKKSEE